MVDCLTIVTCVLPCLPGERVSLCVPGERVSLCVPGAIEADAAWV